MFKAKWTSQKSGKARRGSGREWEVNRNQVCGQELMRLNTFLPRS